MNPRTENLFAWLEARLDRNAPPVTLLDVGAFRGDFSRALLASGRCQSAHLFEPNPSNLESLRNTWSGDARVSIHPVAIGSRVHPARFHATSDTATGSILEYAQADGVVSQFEVEMTTLDEWWRQNQRPSVGILKIDTQGNDCDVLNGAATLIEQMRPVIVAEMIFIPLYRKQAVPLDFFAWGAESGYHFAGLFNEHFTPEGDLAFADAVFLPSPPAAPPGANFLARRSVEAIEEEVRMLRQTCDERANLIEYLHGEAEKRLQIIHQMSSKPTP